jgi:hypothetical protein
MTQTQAKAPPAPPPPAIPGLEQGTPQASNRVGQAQQAPPALPGQPVIQTGPNRRETAQEIGDRIREEIRQARSEGRDPQINFPQNPDFTNVVPRGAVIISVALFASIAFTIVFTPLARAFARRMDSQNQRSLSGGDLAPQIEQLQQSIDTMAVELERITEAQRFQSKLLAARQAEPERVER